MEGKLGDGLPRLEVGVQMWDKSRRRGFMAAVRRIRKLCSFTMWEIVRYRGFQYLKLVCGL